MDGDFSLDSVKCKYLYLQILTDTQMCSKIFNKQTNKQTSKSHITLHLLTTTTSAALQDWSRHFVRTRLITRTFINLHASTNSTFYTFQQLDRLIALPRIPVSVSRVVSVLDNSVSIIVFTFF
ncbi:unnamed protein product [Amoebophrya sp. A120]|nr:unnamed protein product [Amoebophrya sp. A120]|eukprot:GSA120T00013976001.1